jgi:hypothetical protein
MTTGALLGLSTGYLISYGNDHDSAEPFLYGPGIGALVGGGVGLTLGLTDVAADHPGRGAIVLRDTLYGTWFGALAGGIGGGLYVLESDEPEHILVGAAAGSLGGAALGIVFGLIEGQRIVNSAAHRRRGAVLPSLTTTADAGQRSVWVAGFSGQF